MIDDPCVGFLDGPLFIPVVRYASDKGTGLAITGQKTEYNPEQHCDTYYFVEPNSNIL